MNFSKLAFAILLGSASVGTAQKAGKATTSLDEFDCEEYINDTLWFGRLEFGLSTSTCSDAGLDAEVGLEFDCASRLLLDLNPSLGTPAPPAGTQTCLVLEGGVTVADDNGGIPLRTIASVFLPSAIRDAEIDALIATCQQCPVRTGKSGKATTGKANKEATTGKANKAN